MNGKNCRECVYNDGVRITDYSYKCCTPERQRDNSVTDCCVPEAPLRELQAPTKTADEFFAVTQKYIDGVKSQSEYWRKINSHLYK